MGSRDFITRIPAAPRARPPRPASETIVVPTSLPRSSFDGARKSKLGSYPSGCAIGHVQLDQRGAGLGVLEQLERAREDFALSLDVTGRAERPSDRVPGYQDTRHLHRLGDMSEGVHVNRHRRRSRFFDQPGKVSDGHVTFWSSWDEQNRIQLILFEPLHP